MRTRKQVVSRQSERRFVRNVVYSPHRKVKLLDPDLEMAKSGQASS